MHYHAEIYLENLEDIEQQVKEIMKPYDEEVEVEWNEECECMLNPEGFWGYWMIGGRWTGVHTDYDPEKDFSNYSKCEKCDGSGFNFINGEKRICDGCGRHFLNKERELGYFPGCSLNWKFKTYYGDAIHIAGIKDDLTCYTLIVNGEVFHKKKFVYHEDTEKCEFVKNENFNGNVKEKLSELGIADGYLITVDYHN